ncbi:MAG TPA: chloride channel protein [Gammaproteobacteria bacterium]
MRQHLQRSKRTLLSLAAWRVRVTLWGGALLVGLAATFFAEASEYASHLFNALLSFSRYLPLIVTPLGLIAVAWLTLKLFPGAQGSGIPQTLAALDSATAEGVRARVLTLRIAAGKILLTFVGLLSGASIGREGPSVHVGAALMYSIGQRMRFSPHYMERALILSGGAAGIAAAFNTPLAGIVFAIEEMGRSFEERTNGVMLTGVILAGITSLAVLGNYNYFGTTDAHLDSFSDWVVIPVCGVVGGIVGGLFSQLLIVASRYLAPITRAKPLHVAGTCGFVVALLGVLSGNLSYGTGYAEANTIVTSGAVPDPLYPLYKFLATVASYLSGIPGGIFAPTLATGAGLGADLASWFPSVSVAAITILGMVGYFTGVVQTPITAFVIVMEMTDNHTMLLPLMATAFIASTVSKLICPEPIYRALARNFLTPRSDSEANAAPHQAVK